MQTGYLPQLRYGSSNISLYPRARGTSCRSAGSMLRPAYSNCCMHLHGVRRIARLLPTNPTVSAVLPVRLCYGQPEYIQVRSTPQKGQTLRDSRYAHASAPTCSGPRPVPDLDYCAGLQQTGHHFTVPLDWHHASPSSQQTIEVFVREVVSLSKINQNLPLLLFLQGMTHRMLGWHPDVQTLLCVVVRYFCQACQFLFRSWPA